MFEIDTHTDPLLDGLIVRLAGTADYESAEALRTGLDQVVARRPRCVILDLGALQFVNSGAIGRLVELRKQLLVNNSRVIVAGASKYVHECFRLSRLDHAFEMSPTVADAVRSAGGAA